MRVITAEPMGMCFGVRDALELTAGIDDPRQVTIQGQLVHNQQVLVQLEQRGFTQQSEQHRRQLPDTPTVLVTAHGISQHHRRRLLEAGKQIIDATCPLVRRVHLAAAVLAGEGFHVLIIGQPGHVEVLGIVEDLPSFEVLPDPAAVRRFAHRRLGIVCQTTVPPRVAAAVHAAVVARNPAAEIRFVDTICEPTRQRQQAVSDLLDKVDAMVVVGGCNSNNTQQLVRLCAERGLRVCHVESAADLDPPWFAGCAAVGLSAGTSTLDDTILQVRQALERM